MKKTRTLIIICVVLVVAIWLILPGDTIPFLSHKAKTHLGLDLVGGIQVLLEADAPAGQTVDDISMDTAKSIVENRVNGLGVSEAVVVRAGTRRIVVELPGAKDPEQARNAIKQTALLEFVDMSSVSQAEAIALEQSGEAIVTDYQPLSASAALTSTTTLSATTPISLTQPTLPTKVWPTVMTGEILKNAGVTTNQTGQFEVAFELNDAGSKKFAEFTSTHVGSVLAIVLDKKVISAPTIQNAITGGQGVITGKFTRDEANTLAVQLRYGALPIPLKVVETRTVGPSLGQDSLRKSLLAGIIGMSIVIAFMALYYRVPGVIADISIIIYGLITYAIYRGVPITLTLPGIAGFLLSLGSALDANILIFERMKEELRDGRTIEQAIAQGWKRAWSSIRDANIATLITCLILFFFGSVSGATIVKGFSITLLIGIFVSLFTAIIVTRTLLTLILGYFKPTNLSRWFGL